MTGTPTITETKQLAGGRPGSQVVALVRTSDVAAPVVVFLHGIGSRATSFAPLFARMPQRFRLLAWDAPGYGASTPLPQKQPVPLDYAQQLARLLDAYAIRQIDLVGHSLGCLMAGAFARACPQRVRRIVLISPALGYKVAPGATLPDGLARRIADFETLGAERFAATRSQNLIHDPERKPALVEAVRSAMASLTMPGYGQAMRMLGAGDLLADAAVLSAPVLVLTGADDKVTPPAGSRGLCDVLRTRPENVGRHDRFHAVPDAGHAVTLEAPDEVTRAIAEFLGAGP